MYYGICTAFRIVRKNYDYIYSEWNGVYTERVNITKSIETRQGEKRRMPARFFIRCHYMPVAMDFHAHR